MVQLNEPSLRDVLEQAMRREPLLTPADHTGADATQMFRLQLSPEIRQNMLAAIQQAHDCELTTPHTQARGLGGFVQAWQEYASYEG